MKLVSSNDSEFVAKIVKDGLKVYEKDADVLKALDTLTKLKGIGPATASLLLAVHYPEDVPFFSDEAYYWLCNDGHAESLKYSMKEYQALISQARKLMNKLDVSALDVEKVAYVLLKQGDQAPSASATSGPKPKSKPAPKEAAAAAGNEKAKTPSSKKRKDVSSDQDDKLAHDQDPPLRRSKRGRGSGQ